MKEYYKIGEISKIYGIGKDSLMYYEQLGIINPIRDINGYRLYRLNDIWKLNLIKELRHLDFPMKKIKSYLDNRSISTTKEILNQEIDLIDEKIKELLKHKKNIVKRLDAIEEVMSQKDFFEIQIKYILPRKALLLNANITRDEQVDFLIQKLQKEYEERFYILGNNNIGAVFDFEEVKKGKCNIFKSIFCLLEDTEQSYNFILEEGHYLTYNYKDAYRHNPIYIKEMLSYIKQKGYQIIGDPIEIYKIDIHETGKEEEFMTEIQIPIFIQEKKHVE